MVICQFYGKSMTIVILLGLFLPEYLPDGRTQKTDNLMHFSQNWPRNRFGAYCAIIKNGIQFIRIFQQFPHPRTNGCQPVNR